MNTKKIKEIIRQKYAWPGGYELFFITSDGAAICTDCARANFREICESVKRRIDDGWRVVGYETECNVDGPIACEHCYKVIVADPNE